MKNKVRIFVAVVMMVVVMCCPLAVQAVNTTNQMVETEEELSFEGMVEDVIDAFEKKHDNAFEVNYRVFESFAELEEHWRGDMKSNEILIGVVRNTHIVKSALGSRVGVEAEALNRKVNSLDYDSYELWEEWAFDVLRVFLTDNSYELLDASSKNNLIDDVQSGLFKFGNIVMWFLILLAVFVNLFVIMKVMKVIQEMLLARSQRMTEKKTKSRSLRKAEEKCNLAKCMAETEEYELHKLEIKLKMIQLQNEINANQARITEKSSEEPITNAQDSDDEKSEE